METQRAVQGSCAKDGCVPYHLYLFVSDRETFSAQDAGLRDVIIESGVIFRRICFWRSRGSYI